MVNFSDFNSTSEDLYSLPDTFRIPLVGLYIVVLLLAVVGNSLIIRCCLLSKKRKKVSALFVCSFAVSNITISLLCMPFTVVSNIIFYYWLFPLWLCPVTAYIQLVVVIQRVCSLVALTLHRHRSIVYLSAKKLTKRNGAIITILLWVFSAVFALPAVLQSKVIFLSKFPPGIYGLCVEDWNVRYMRNSFTIAIALVQYVIPLVILTVAHIRVLTAVFRRKVPGEKNRARDEMLKRSKRKTLVFLVLVVIIYAILWLPLQVITVVGDHIPSIYDHSFAHMVWIFCHWLALSDTCTYPLLVLYKRRKKEMTLWRLICGDASEMRRNSNESVPMESSGKYLLKSHKSFSEIALNESSTDIRTL